MTKSVKDIFKKIIVIIILIVLIVLVAFSNSKDKKVSKEIGTQLNSLSTDKNTKDTLTEVEKKDSPIKDQKAQYFSLATEQMQAGNLRLSIENFQKVVNIDPNNNFEPQNIRALAGELSLYLSLARNGDYRDSDNKRIIEVTTRIINSGSINDLELAGVYFARGAAYATTKQYDEAITDFDIVIKLNPSMREEALNFKQEVFSEKEKLQ